MKVLKRITVSAWVVLALAGVRNTLLQNIHLVSKAEEPNPISYNYDNLGRVKEAYYNNGTVVTYSYDKNGNIEKVTVSSSSTSEEGTTTESNKQNKDDKKSGEENRAEIQSYNKKDGIEDKEDASDNVSDNINNENNEIIIPSAPLYAVDELKILNAFKRSKPIIKSLKRSKKKGKYYITAKISRIEQNEILKTIHFQIKYSNDSKFKKSKTVTVKQSNNGITGKHFEVSNKKTYYVKVRAYIKTKSGRRVYSKYSKVKKIKKAK